MTAAPRTCPTVLTWSPPYHGVQHLSGHPSLDGGDYQVSIEAYDGWADWCVLALRGNSPLRAIREGETRSAELARKLAESAFMGIIGEARP